MQSAIRVLALVTLVIGMFASTPASAQGVNVSGEWAFNVQTDQGSGTPTMTFKQQGETLTGSYNGQFGTAELKGTLKGNVIHWVFTVDVGGQMAPYTYDGTVEKNTMQGKLDIGGQINGTFTATKK